MTTVQPSSGQLELDIPAENRRANLSPARLYEAALERGEAILAAQGPLLATTGPHTGRSPNDRFVVKGGASAGEIDWGAVNKPIETEAFERLFGLASDFVQANPVYVFEGYAGADPRVPPQGAGGHPACLAQPVRAQHVPARGRSGQARGLRARLHRGRHSVPARRSRSSTAPTARPSSCSTSRVASPSSVARNTPGRSRRASSR